MADSTSSTAATAEAAAEDVRTATAEALDAPKAAAPPKPPTRSPEEISADLERARQSLVHHLDEIQEYVKPANVLERGTRRFRRIYVTDDGKPKVKTIAVTAAVIGLYVLYRIRK